MRNMSFNFDMLQGCVKCKLEIRKTQASMGVRNTGDFHLSCWNELSDEEQKTLLAGSR